MGASLPVPQLTTKHPPAFQFCQVLIAGYEETARDPMGGWRKTPSWEVPGLTLSLYVRTGLGRHLSGHLACQASTWYST